MKNFFVSWHYTTHGLAYLKHVLSVFSERGVDKEEINWTGLSQVEYNDFFSRKKVDFRFDEVHYLTASQQAYDRIIKRSKYRNDVANRDELVKSQKMTEVWQALMDWKSPEKDDYFPVIEEEYKFITKEFNKAKADKYLDLVWRDMQHFPISEQIKWFMEQSNAKQHYEDRLTVHELPVKNLRDAYEIAGFVRPFVSKLLEENDSVRLFINISLGTSETQVVWHALSQAGRFPKNTVFLQTYDSKDDPPNTRFKNFYIKKVPLKLFYNIKLPLLFDATKLNSRQIAQHKLKHFISNGFITLLLGEKGIGKSHLIKEFADSDNVVEINCASFADNDELAELALFGGVAGERAEEKGLFEQADGGLLFLDDVHLLSKKVQGKLMSAMETDSENNFSIRISNSREEVKVQCAVVLASNKSIQELRGEILTDDFFDRITQNVLKLPPLRDCVQDRENDWSVIWTQMKFEEKLRPNTNEFLEWLKELQLYGNYRDLQKIAIYCHSYMKFPQDLKKLLKEEGIHDFLHYAKSEFENLQPKAIRQTNVYFSKDRKVDETLKLFKQDFAIWLNEQFGSMQKASDHFQNNFKDTVSPRALYQWKNGK